MRKINFILLSIACFCITSCDPYNIVALEEREVCIFRFSDSSFVDKIILDQIDDTLGSFHTSYADLGPDREGCSRGCSMLERGQCGDLQELPCSTDEIVIPLADGYYYFGRYVAIGSFEPIAIDATWDELPTITSAKSLGNPFCEMWMIPIKPLYHAAHVDHKNCIHSYDQLTEALNNLIIHKKLQKQCINVEHWNYLVPGMTYSETNHFYPNPGNITCYEEGYHIKIY